jgi:uncharacterized protein YkwD
MEDTVLRSITAKAAALLVAAVAVAGLAATASTATAADSNAAAFVTRTNAARRAQGLPGYAVAADLAAVARRHSAEMAAKQSLYHNPNLGSEVSGWQVVGENVGTGGTVDSIHTAFMNSPAHRANILATDYTQIGVGTVTDANGRMWVTEVFRLPYRASVVTAPVTVRAARSATRTAPVTAPRRPVARPAAPVAHRAVPVPLAPVRADAAAFAAALAPAGAAAPVTNDPLAQALTYTAAMSALTA